MVGILIIGKNGVFYKIHKSLVSLNIRGNYNKVVNPFRITNLYINGNNNRIEVVDDGEINFIKVMGNNNKIYMKNISRPNYIDHGIANSLIKTHSPFIPLDRRNHRHSSNNNDMNNNNNLYDNLEEKIYSEIPDNIKSDNLNKCSLCDETFYNFENVKIFTCKKHVFHRRCIKDYIRSNPNSPRCPRCENNNNNNLNIPTNSIVPHNVLTSNINEHLNSRDNSRNNLDNNSDNNNHDEERNDPNNDNESNNIENNDNEDNVENDNNDNEEEESNDDFNSVEEIGLDKEILDNMIISKITNVEALDNDKKNCAICLETYVNGDKSIALPCIHIFHSNCIKTWLTKHNNCPICKHEVNYDIEDFENDEL